MTQSTTVSVLRPRVGSAHDFSLVYSTMFIQEGSRLSTWATSHCINGKDTFVGGIASDACQFTFHAPTREALVEVFQSLIADLTDD